MKGYGSLGPWITFRAAHIQDHGLEPMDKGDKSPGWGWGTSPL